MLLKVRTVVRDFRDANELSFYTELLAQIEDLDISVVVHAVGMAALSRKFHHQAADLNRQSVEQFFGKRDAFLKMTIVFGCFSCYAVLNTVFQSPKLNIWCVFLFVTPKTESDVNVKLSDASEKHRLFMSGNIVWYC